MEFKKSILVLVVLVCALGGYFYMKQNKVKSRTLRVAFPADYKVDHYEPTNISIDFEYILLENIFSPLVEMDVNGTIIPGVAEKVFWDGDELHLEIRKNLKTQSGAPINIEDVVFSLKRLLLLSGNTHGNFKDLVCSGVEFKSIEQDCPGIRISDQTLILKSLKRKSFLLPMLAAIDFAIIPKGSVNQKTLAIENYKETSGPYYVESDEDKGHVVLKLNKYHYHATTDIADTIILVPFSKRNSKESLNALINNEVDLLTTVDAARADEQISVAKEHPDFENHVTQKIRSHLLVFTQKGIESLSQPERRYIAQKVRLAFNDIYGSSPGFEPRTEFFPSLGEGGLNPEQEKLVADANKEAGIQPKKTIRLGLIRRGGIEPWSEPIKKYLSNTDCYFEDNAPDLKKNLNANDIPDAFIVSTDTGFMEDIGLISYSLNAGLLGLTKSERNEWLANYMAIDEKKDRLVKLKELHFNALITPWIVPLMASPYSATVRKPWKIKLSDLYANNQLWLIKTE